MDAAFIREIFKKNGVPIYQNDVWKVQKVWVFKHAALERLAAAMDIVWGEPKVILATDDHFVVMVSATRSDKRVTEWSLGEAKIVRMVDSGRKNDWGKPIYEAGEGEIGNYQITPKQGAYPAAMAEKRGKDRVILKLAGLHGAYSEDEAAEFKRQQQAKAQQKIAERGGQQALPDRSRNRDGHDDRRQPVRRDDRRR